MIHFTEEEKSSLDSVSFRSILNLEHKHSQSSARAAAGTVAASVKKSPFESSSPSKNAKREQEHATRAAANLASFYLTPNEDELDEYDVEDEEESAKHGVDPFKSVHIPGDDLAVDNKSASTSTARRNSNSLNESKDAASSSTTAGIELDAVKHKLSSIWNNVKYGRISLKYEESLKSGNVRLIDD